MDFSQRCISERWWLRKSSRWHLPGSGLWLPQGLQGRPSQDTRQPLPAECLLYNSLASCKYFWSHTDEFYNNYYKRQRQACPPNTQGTAGCPRTVIKRVGTALLGHTRSCLQRLPEVLGKPVVHASAHKNNPSLRSGPLEPVKTRLTEVKSSRVGSSGAWHGCAPR